MGKNRAAVEHLLTKTVKIWVCPYLENNKQ